MFKQITKQPTGSIHVGGKIEEILEEKHLTKRELGDMLNISGANARHLTTRESVDVLLLQRVGNALKYNFFKHYPIVDGSLPAANVNDKAMEELREKIAEGEKQMEGMKRQEELQQQQIELLRPGERVPEGD